MSIRIIHVIIFWVFLFALNQANACSCSMGSIEEKYENAHSVFIGHVSSIKRLGTANIYGDENIIVTFDNVMLYKGKNKKELHTAYNGSGCTGYWFKKDQRYLIYTFERKDGSLDAMWCGGVIPQDENEEIYSREVETVRKLQWKK